MALRHQFGDGRISFLFLIIVLAANMHPEGMGVISADHRNYNGYGLIGLDSTRRGRNGG